MNKDYGINSGEHWLKQKEVAARKEREQLSEKEWEQLKEWEEFIDPGYVDPWRVEPLLWFVPIMFIGVGILALFGLLSP